MVSHKSFKLLEWWVDSRWVDECTEKRGVKIEKKLNYMVAEKKFRLILFWSLLVRFEIERLIECVQDCKMKYLLHWTIIFGNMLFHTKA